MIAPEVAEHTALCRQVEPKFAARVLDAMTTLKTGINHALLLTALEHGQAELAVEALPWPAFRQALETGVRYGILRTMAASGQTHHARVVAGKVRKADPGFQGRFDLTNPAAVRAAAERTAWLVQGVDQRTRDAIAEVIRRGQLGQLDVPHQARLIENLVGLDSRQANALVNYEWYLRGLGKPESQIERMVQREYARRLRYRATTIARTESARAAIIGQNEAWRQAADNGYLDRATTERVWVAALNPCPICADLNGQHVGLDEPFGPDINGNTYDGPPGPHPNCLCALSLSFRAQPARQAA